MTVKIFHLVLVLLLLSGCACYGVVENNPQSGGSADQSYSFDTKGNRGAGDISLVLAFAGGGTRAAALANGVMLELRDTEVVVDGKSRRMLDEVDAISSVSGGSFTSAYYGLFGDRIFDDFEEAFLKRDVQGRLIHARFNPVALENYAGCDPAKLQWLAEARERVADNPDLLNVVEGLESYGQKDKRKYAHFADGGITDNLGLRAIYEIVEVAGGADVFMKSIGRKVPRHLVVISVNASTDPEPEPEMDLSNERPSIEEAIGAVSSAQHG